MDIFFCFKRNVSHLYNNDVIIFFLFFKVANIVWAPIKCETKRNEINENETKRKQQKRNEINEMKTK